jgi:hypothetical protein
MEFRHIFTKPEHCNLWAVQYPEDEADIFKQLFDKWSDTEYLLDFMVNNQPNLNFWKLTVDEAVDKAYEEAEHFSDELWAIETGYPGYENISLQDIFIPLHNNVYSMVTRNERQRKGRPNKEKPMLRLYAIELEEGCMVITGGAIKLIEKMEGEVFEREFIRLKRVQEYLKEQGISTRDGLLNN